MWTKVYKVELDYDSAYHPRILTIVDGVDLDSNTVIFYCPELDMIDRKIYEDYCLYMTLSDNNIRPKTTEYYEQVKDLLNFKIDDYIVVDTKEGPVIEYKNDLQRIFNNNNNIYYGTCPYVQYNSKSYSLLHPLPEDVKNYVDTINACRAKSCH